MLLCSSLPSHSLALPRPPLRLLKSPLGLPLYPARPPLQPACARPNVRMYASAEKHWLYIHNQASTLVLLRGTEGRDTARRCGRQGGSLHDLPPTGNRKILLGVKLGQKVGWRGAEEVGGTGWGTERGAGGSRHFWRPVFPPPYQVVQQAMVVQQANSNRLKDAAARCGMPKNL